jgi:hypothetical protein
VGGARRTRKLTTIECEIAADQLARGKGLSQTLYNVNGMRVTEGKAKVGRTTLRDNVMLVLRARRQRTMTRPTGNKNVDSPWAVARLQQAKQYKAQLARGAARLTRGGAADPVKALPLASIAWWDEKHAKCVLGSLNKHSWTYPIGPDGRYLPEARAASTLSRRR